MMLLCGNGVYGGFDNVEKGCVFETGGYAGVTGERERFAFALEGTDLLDKGSVDGKAEDGVRLAQRHDLLHLGDDVLLSRVEPPEFGDPRDS